MVTNTTENKDCSDSLLVNFTCVASEANPAVESYQLYRNGEVINVSDRENIREISEDGKHDYSCLAIHPVKNVRSSNNVTVTFNGEFGKVNIGRHKQAPLSLVSAYALTRQHNLVVKLDSPCKRLTCIRLNPNF